MHSELVKGYEDAAQELPGDVSDLYQKTGNWIDDKGFYTKEELLRIDALNTELKEALAYFVPGTDAARYGIYIERNIIGDEIITGIIDYSTDGAQKNTYQFGDLDTITGYRQDNYIVVDGQQVKSHELIYSDDSRMVNTYDSSGNSIYRTANYQYSDGTYVLNYVDDWMVGANGEVIKDFKQTEKNYAGIIMNDNRLAPGLFGDTGDKYNPKNYIGNSGCLLTSVAIVDDFNGGAYGDPKKMDTFVDQKGLYFSKYTADVNLQSLVQNLEYIPGFSNNGTIDLYKTQIDTNIDINIPTIIQFSNNPKDSHFAVIGGTRFNGDGSNDYLIRDPGSSESKRSLLDGDTLSNSRGQAKRLDWMSKEVNK